MPPLPSGRGSTAYRDIHERGVIRELGADHIARKSLQEEEMLERAMGIEPTSLAWEARVMAIIRRPQSQ